MADQPDDSVPTPERQAELRAAYEANVAAGKAPYEGVHIRTRGELQWVMDEREWSGEIDSAGKSRADFRCIDFQGAILAGAHLARADLRDAIFSEMQPADGHLWTILKDSPAARQGRIAGTDIAEADVSITTFLATDLQEAHLEWADLRGAMLFQVNLTRARLDAANLKETNLRETNLSNANLVLANLEDASLRWATLRGADLSLSNLYGADLSGARMDATTVLLDAKLSTRTRLADVVWNDVPVTRLNWEDVPVLGDEYVARQPKDAEGKNKDRATRLAEYTDAVLANRQVAILLRSQGVNDESDYFAFRAQLLQRVVLRRKALLHQRGRRGNLWRRVKRLSWYIGSLLLDLIAGYGYRPLRSLIAYVLIIAVFTGAYFLNAQFAAPHLTWDEALVLSISSFHGRGFFTSGISLGDTLARLAAGEAIIGLLIEITFIATFTQRFFAR